MHPEELFMIPLPTEAVDNMYLFLELLNLWVALRNCCCSVAQSCPTLWPHGLQHARPPCPSPSLGVHPSPCPSLWQCHPDISSSDALFLLSPSIFPSISNFSNELFVCIRWPNYWNFRFSISPFSEYSGLISLKIDWFDLLAVQGTSRSLLQHHSLKASILWGSAFSTVQLSQLNVTTGKTIALTVRTFVDRVMSAFQHTGQVRHQQTLCNRRYLI